MEMDKFEALRNVFQDVIDLVSQKNAEEARNKLTKAADMFNEMLDHTISDDELTMMRQYQMLLRQLEEIIALLN